MWEKLLSSFKKNPFTYLRLCEKNIIVEERFGKNKDIIKKYHILDISEKDKTIIYSLVGCNYFIYSAPFKYLSKNFIEQISKQINNDTLISDEEIAEMA